MWAYVSLQTKRATWGSWVVVVHTWIPALWRQRQMPLSEFKDSLSTRTISRTVSIQSYREKQNQTNKKDSYEDTTQRWPSSSKGVGPQKHSKSSNAFRLHSSSLRHFLVAVLAKWHTISPAKAQVIDNSFLNTCVMVLLKNMWTISMNTLKIVLKKQCYLLCI